MQRVIWATAVMVMAAGGASASVIEPSLGVVATESEVGGRNSYSDPNYPLGFHVVSGTGTPGTDVVNYNPAGYFAPTSSAVSGYDTEVSGNGTNPVTAVGSAAADLNSGQIHLTGQAVRQGVGVNTSVAYIAAGGALSDVITITGPITAPVTIRISMTVDGSISSSGPNDPVNGLAVFALSVVGGGNAYAELFLNDLSGGYVQEQNTSVYGGQVITDGGNAAALQFTLYDDVVVTDTSRTIPFDAVGEINLVSPDSPGSITADFGNTARLQISEPDGLGFTSQSGVLLTAPQDADGTTTVPEPASLLMLGIGLLGAQLVRSARGNKGAGRDGSGTGPLRA